MAIHPNVMRQRALDYDLGFKNGHIDQTYLGVRLIIALNSPNGAYAQGYSDGQRDQYNNPWKGVK